MDKPEEVLRALSSELRKRKITRAHVAEAMGYRSTQSIANLLASKTYLNSSQAHTLSEAYGFSEIYLMKGIGSLIGNDFTQGIEVQDKIEALERHYSFVLQRFEEVAEIINDDTLKAVVSKLSAKKDILYLFVKKNPNEKNSTIDKYTCDIDEAIKTKMKQFAQKYKCDYPITTKKC